MRTNCTASIATLALAAGVARGGVVDPALDAVLREADPNEIVSVLVFHVDQVDLTALSAQLDTERASRRKRHEVVIRALQETAAFSGAPLRAHLGALQQAGRIERFNTFWIANIARMDAPPAEIVALSARADVDRVYLNYAVAAVLPVAGDAGGVVAHGGVEPGVEAVRAPDVWALGIDGAGTVVATIDFGVDGNHAALADRWRGVARSSRRIKTSARRVWALETSPRRRGSSFWSSMALLKRVSASSIRSSSRSSSPSAKCESPSVGTNSRCLSNAGRESPVCPR